MLKFYPRPCCARQAALLGCSCFFAPQPGTSLKAISLTVCDNSSVLRGDVYMGLDSADLWPLFLPPCRYCDFNLRIQNAHGSILSPFSLPIHSTIHSPIQRIIVPQFA